MKDLTEYDEQQLKLMYESLTCYERNRISLCSLVGNLESLYRTLNFNEEQWDKEFFEEWEALEIVKAVEIINESKKVVSDLEKDEKEKLIENAISKLKFLIRKRIL